MIPVIITLLAVSTTASELSFDMNIVERPARYVQRVVTDLSDNHVMYQTPAHNTVLESHKIQDFQRGIQITCLPYIRECHMQRLDKSINTNAGNTTESIVHMWNKGVNSIDEKDCNIIQENIILAGAEIKDTTFLTQKMRLFLTKFGYPLYPTKALSKGAVIERLPAVNVSSIPLSHVTSKRESINELKCVSVAAEAKYGYTVAEHCHHLYLCKGPPHPSSSGGHLTCGNEHIHTNMFYKCLCCHGYFTLDDPKHCQCFRFD